jgi:superfamily I DNA/RNA helicase
MDNLLKRPSIIIGTIHSVKGGEADVVYLFPDLSLAGINEWHNTNGDDTYGKDSIIRLFYVAMTRAKQELVICNASQQYYVQL